LTLFAFRNSYIRIDGLRSIRRSFTRNELKEIAPKDWSVAALFPFRLLAVCDKTGTN